MKKILLLSLLFFVAACDEKNTTTTTDTIQKDNSEITNNISKKGDEKFKEKDILKELGFVINGDKVTIDMNQTAEFMKKMEIEMHGKADEIERKIEKQDINFTRDFGFEIDETHVTIDLNKTRDMLQQINILMKDILLEGNTTSH